MTVTAEAPPPGDVAHAPSGDAGGALSYLATTAANVREKRFGLAVAAVSVIVFAALIPFTKVKLPVIPAFIPTYETALIVMDLVTAVLLIGQYFRLRSPAILMLAAGYYFDAALIVAHFLSFPGVFSETGLIGAGPQTTAWLYIAWHGGFPLFVIAYVVLRDVDASRLTMGPSELAIGTAAFVTILVVAMTIATTVGHDFLPPILVDGRYTPAAIFCLGGAWVLSIVALGVLWWRGIRSILDVWVAVVMVAWIADIGLSAVFNGGRYDLGFYFGRIYGLFAASFVLAIILWETTGLHSRVVASNVRLAGEVKESRDRQRSTEDLLRQAQKMEAIGNLTGGIAHDFNNLLAIVIGNLDILVERRKDDREVKELGGEALDAALRGADLTRRLLAFARRQPLNPEPLDLNGFISEIAKLLKRTLGENIEIEVDLNPGLWPAIADPAQLGAALTNLATNARDAMPNGGRVIIVTGNRNLDADYAARHADVVPGDYAMIEVSDSGSGMDPEVIERAFEPFFTTKEMGKGSGLGLSMVYGFIKQSGGHINIYSEPGIGTTFRLYLPRVASASRGAAPAPASSAEAATGTILAVEDNGALRRIVARQLRDLGYKVIEADNAATARKVLETEHVDLLFTDVVMTGGTSGIDLAREALGRWPNLKVLITSGFPETKLNGNGHEPIPARLLNKPYRKEELARAIRETLAG